MINAIQFMGDVMFRAMPVAVVAVILAASIALAADYATVPAATSGFECSELIAPGQPSACLRYLQDRHAAQPVIGERATPADVVNSPDL